MGQFLGDEITFKIHATILKAQIIRTPFHFIYLNTFYIYLVVCCYMYMTNVSCCVLFNV